MGLVLAGLGEKLDGLLKPLKDRVFIKTNEKIDQLVKTLILVALILLVMSLIPAGIFAAIEGWSYGDAVYYTIITMTTIGFGDFVIGKLDLNIFSLCVYVCGCPFHKYNAGGIKKLAWINNSYTYLIRVL